MAIVQVNDQTKESEGGRESERGEEKNPMNEKIVRK